MDYEEDYDTDVDLEFVPTANLIVELFNRHDAIVLAATKNKGDDTESAFVLHNGSLYTCWGLAHEVQQVIGEEQLVQRMKEGAGDEEENV